MIKKAFKTIFILTLCLGISLPSNAAVSVSDGSAFVTKSEFDADVNNISNRMAQLENSLDAKIDSLVSSYLTRNGIWNGAKQTLVSDGSEGFVGVKKGVNASSRLINYPKASSIAYDAGNVSEYDKMLDIYSSPTTTGTLVEAVSKTGMLYFVMRYALNDKHDTADYSGSGKLMPKIGADTVRNINGDWPYMVLGSFFIIKTSTTPLWTMQNSSSFPVPSSQFGYSVPSATGVFFVNKGDKLYWEIQNTTKGGYVCTYNGGTSEYFGYRYQILDVSVY